ncbi:hypothetical protein BD289DRAFT_233975 [Coniella lustricola]|uniref:Uncharacterized protein n=1 Tax=Coniella lustricola TaxID=2025994 RepID=A0A2T2ZRQ2_9PEZI|nr:hypothetical protein BD289DRAFT_233975 [Coniella lustricola]
MTHKSAWESVHIHEERKKREEDHGRTGANIVRASPPSQRQFAPCLVRTDSRLKAGQDQTRHHRPIHSSVWSYCAQGQQTAEPWGIVCDAIQHCERSRAGKQGLARRTSFFFSFLFFSPVVRTIRVISLLQFLFLHPSNRTATGIAQKEKEEIH